MGAQVTLAADVAAFKTVSVDGVDCLCILEQGWGDGGLVVNYLSPKGDGTYWNHRHWFSDPAAAKQAFAEADAGTVAEKRDLIISLSAANEAMLAKEAAARAVVADQAAAPAGLKKT